MRCDGCGFVLYQNPACAAAGVVLNDRCQVLLVRRAIPPFRGYWALPAGYQEIDETPATTITREVLEEAGVVIEVQGLLDLLYIQDDPRKPANVAVFLCRAVRGEPRPGVDECDARWFPLDHLPPDIGFENYERILGRLLRRDSYPESPWNSLGRWIEDSGIPTDPQ
jgi:ADP-ribose pyrophosphatase YjhB (NUDIX family)